MLEQVSCEPYRGVPETPFRELPICVVVAQASSPAVLESILRQNYTNYKVLKQ